MTVHTYNATLEGKDGLKYHATIFWEKEHPSTLIATIAPFLPDGTVGQHVARWTRPYGVAGQGHLVSAIYAAAILYGCNGVDGSPTDHAPQLGDQ